MCASDEGRLSDARRLPVHAYAPLTSDAVHASLTSEGMLAAHGRYGESGRYGERRWGEGAEERARPLAEVRVAEVRVAEVRVAEVRVAEGGALGRCAYGRCRRDDGWWRGGETAGNRVGGVACRAAWKKGGPSREGCWRCS